MSIFFQIVCTTLLCLNCFNMGIMFAWPSSTLLIFRSVNTTLHRPMTEGEAALLGSLSSVGAMISTALAGFLLDKIGRKACCIMAASTSTLGWMIVAASNRVELVLLAIFISGFSCSAFTINPIYITEICQKSIRGSMMSSTMVYFSIGMLVSYVLGGCLDYNRMIYVNLACSVIANLLPFVLYESPLYLMAKELEEEALKSLAYYRRASPNSEVVKNELLDLKRILNTEIDESTPENEKLNSDGYKRQKLSKFQFLKKSRTTHRALFVVLVLMTATIFQGLPVLQVYAEPLFAEATPNLSSNLCSIIFAVINVVFGFLAAYLSDVAGRRPLLLYGSLASGFSCLLLGSQIHLNWGPNWLTAVAIYVFSIVYMLGAGIVPFVVVGEVFLPEVKSIVMMMISEWAWLCNFLILLIFNPLVSAVGLGPVFYLFSLICFLTMIFGYYYLPETKGLSVDVIQTLFGPRKKQSMPL